MKVVLKVELVSSTLGLTTRMIQVPVAMIQISGENLLTMNMVVLML